MIRRPPRSTLSSSSAASDVYKRQGFQRRQGVVHPVLRLRPTRRQPLDDPVDGVSAGRRPPGAGDHRSGGARAVGGWFRPPVPDGGHGRRRWADRSGGGVPGLLLLAGRLSVAAGPRPRCQTVARAAPGPAQRPRAALRGVRPGGGPVGRQLSPGVLARLPGQLGLEDRRPREAHPRPRRAGTGSAGLQPGQERKRGTAPYGWLHGTQLADQTGWWCRCRLAGERVTADQGGGHHATRPDRVLDKEGDGEEDANAEGSSAEDGRGEEDDASAEGASKEDGRGEEDDASAEGASKEGAGKGRRQARGRDDQGRTQVSPSEGSAGG